MGKKNIVWNDYPEDLAPLDSKLWRRHQEKNSYNEYIRDTVKLWKHRDKKYILGLEPEESPQYALPVKYMNYESVQYDRQYKGRMKAHRKNRDLRANEYLTGFSATDRLLPIITIGIYLGEKKWSGYHRLSEMTGRKEEPGEISRYLAPFCNEFHANLINIYDLKTCDVFQTDLREVFGFLRFREDKKQLRS